MSLSSTTDRVSYSGTGALTAFTVPFKFFADSDLVVVLQDVDGVDTAQVLNTDYTVSGAGNESGGTVTFTVAPGATDTVVIYRDAPATQLTDYTEGDSFPVESMEAALDKLTMLVQRLRTRLSRTPELTNGDVDGSGRYDANSNRIINLADPEDSQDAATKAWVATQILEGALADYTGTVTAFGASLLDDADAAEAFTTLGISAYIQTLLNDADAATAQGTLGVSAFIQTLLDDVDAATARTTLGVTATPEPRPNLLVNPDFQIWQLGTTVDGGTTPANNDDTYVCDQWILLSDGNDRADITKETSVVPDYAPSAIKLTMVGTDKKLGILQPIPADAVRSFSGEVVSLSFQARHAGSGDLTLIRAGVVAWDNTFTADAITSDIVSAWNTSGTNPTLISDVAFANTPAALSALTTSYQTFSITNITVPANTVNLGVFIWIEDTSYTAADALYIGNAKLEVGSTASAFYSRSYAEELALCERFFEKTFNTETAPANNAGTAGAITSISVGTAANSLSRDWRFRQRKLKTPTISTYNPSSGTAGYWTRELPSSGHVSQAGADRIGHSGCRLYNVGVASSAYLYSIHAVADARL